MAGSTKRLNTGQDDLEIGICSDECSKHDPEKEGHDPEKCHENEPKTLNDPKFDLKNSLDTLPKC